MEPGEHHPEAQARLAGLTVDEILERIPGAIWVADPELRLLGVWGQLKKELEYLGEVIGRSLYDLIGREEAPPISTHHRALRGEAAEDRYSFRGHWFDLRIDPLVDEAGKVRALIGTAMDVTLTEQAQDKVRRSLSLFEATLESTADGLLVVDLEGNLIAWNQRFVTMWRLPENLIEEGIDAALLAAVADQLAEPEQFLRGVRDLYARPDAESLDVLYFRDGRVFERSSRPQRVEGKPVGRVWSFRDITVREKVLARAQFLADASRLLASLDVESALKSLARLAVPTFADACAVDLFGNGEPRRVASAGTIEPALSPVALRGTATIDNTQRPMLSAPILTRGRVTGVLTLVRAFPQYGAPELEMIEELARRVALAVENAQLYRGAEEAVNLREEFISVAAHELRGPLSSIRLATQTLRRTPPGDASPERLLELIERESRRMARFVDDLVDVTRARAGRFHLELEEMDLVALVKEVSARMHHEVEQPLPPISLNAAGEVRGRWDRSRLDQVVTNLLSNAIKYGKGNPVELSVSAEDGQAVLRVRDRGIGIAPQMRSRIFEPFERASPLGHYGSLGLGLYIVKHIVTALGGEITVESTEDAGTVFTVRLPIHHA